MRLLMSSAVFLVATTPALAAPPEVTDLALTAPSSLVWDGQAGAGGYHHYRSVITGSGRGFNATCLAGSIQAAATTDTEEPAPGSVFLYAVAAFDASGTGPVGFSSSGVENVPSIPCIPSRRSFPLVPEVGSDGLPEDEPPEGSIARSASTPGGSIDVLLHSGEVVVRDYGRGPGYFRSIGGLSVEQEVVEYKEGGVNEFTRKLMGATKWPNIVLKRGFTSSKAFFQWVKGSVNRGAGDDTTEVSTPLLGIANGVYRSLVRYDGPFGHGWDFGANARVRPMGGDILWYDGAGRCHRLMRIGPTSWALSEGISAKLFQQANGSFAMRFADGAIRRYRPFDGSSTQGALDADEDLKGNRISYLYDHQGLLTTIVDELGRAHTLHYDDQGRVSRWEDFDGRETAYTYDEDGNLVSARTPIVTGTPNGNDFPSGKTTHYAWSSGFADDRLNHNLLSIISPNEAPAGSPFVQLAYDESSASPHVDRVTSQTLGDPMSGVGGVLGFAYEQLNAGADPDDRMIPRRRTIVTDRNGNLSESLHNANGQPLAAIDRTNRELRPGEPDYAIQYAYDAAGRLVSATTPEGNVHTFLWDTAADAYRRGNLLEWRTIADGLAFGGRGDGHGGELPDRSWTFAYEPVGNQPSSTIDPRGGVATWTYDYQEGDPSSNGIAALAGQFGITLSGTPFNLGDLNGDGRVDQAMGVPIRREPPVVTLDPGSSQAAIEGDTQQESVTLLTYNGFGQLTGILDAEGNRHEIAYHAEIDPDGDGSPTPPPPDGRMLETSEGGLPHRFVWDYASDLGRNNGTNPPPVLAQLGYEYDARGNVTRSIDPRGVAADYIHNQLDQVVEIRAASATAPSTGRGESGLTPLGFATRFAYDANDNLVRVEREDVGETRGVGSSVDVTYAYDLLDNMIATRRETTTGLDVESLYDYDANENRTLVTTPEGRAHTFSWDERDLPLASTSGAAGPFGGSPATRQHSYDANGNLVRIVDGRGGLIDYDYDGFDRLVRRIDQTGNTTELLRDPSGNVVRRLDRGPVGGPAPPDRSGSTNVDLADTRYAYDARDRMARVDRMLFVPAGASPVRPPVIEEGASVPGDGAVNEILEYDKLSRPTFDVEDTGATTRYDYDGLSRRIRTTHPDGSDLEAAWDGVGNLIEQVATDVSSTSGPPSERFFTTFFHDPLGRLTMSVDNLGQTRRLVHDSLDAIVAATDAKGPMSGSIQRRSPSGGGMAVAVNEHGNVTRYAYDPLDRLIQVEQILSASGQGNGTLAPPPDTANPANPDGRVVVQLGWDFDDLRVSAHDDNGNATLYEYDNLGRLVRTQADDGTAALRAYDEEGNPVQTVDANGTAIQQGYDPSQRRVLSILGTGGSTEGTTQQTFQHDGMGRMTRATDNNWLFDATDDATTTFIYDSLGRRIEETAGMSDGIAPGTTGMHWLAGDLATLMTYPSGREIQYSYDAADRLVLVADPSGPGAAFYEYFGMTRVHTRRYGNGVRSTVMSNTGTSDIGFDGALRAVLIRHLDPSSNLLAGFESRYDRNGNRTSHRRGHHRDAAHNAMGEMYVYDSADRLVAFQEGFLNAAHLPASSPSDAQTWSLDGAGNWKGFTRLTTPYGSTPNNNNEYDEAQSGGMRFDDGIPDDFGDNLLTPPPDGMNLAHDRNGNRTAGGTLQFYDGHGRLVRAARLSDGMTIAVYAYDALGRRVKRTLGSGGPAPVTMRSWYWGSGDIEERDGSGATARQTVHGLGGGGGGGGIWQVRATGSVEYLLEDALGSTVAMTAGMAPQVLERVTYDAYGKPTLQSALNANLTDPTGAPIPMSTVGNPRLFAGMHYDPELGARAPTLPADRGGMYRTWHRYYDPNLGRFLTRDPQGVWGDPAGAGNGYAYAGGNPVNWTDPTGLSTLKKLAIAPEKGEKIEVYFNPKEYTITKSTPWKHHDIQGLDAPTLEISDDGKLDDLIRELVSDDDSSEGTSYDVHAHTIAEWFFDSPLNLFAPRKAYGGPVAMGAEAAFQHNDFDLPSKTFARTVVSGYDVWAQDTLRRFNPRISSAPQVKKVRVRGWDPARKEEIVVETFARGTIPYINSMPSMSIFDFSVQNIPLIGSVSVGFTIVPPAAPSGSPAVTVQYSGQRSNPFPFTKN